MPAREFAVIFFCSRSASATNGRAKRRQAKRCKTQMLGINMRQQQQQQQEKTPASLTSRICSLARPPSLSYSHSLCLCLDMCDPNVLLFVNSYKSPRRTQCDHCASKRRNKPTTRIGTDCAKPRERERRREGGERKTKQEHKMGTLINSTKTQLNATSATDANAAVVVEENHY